MDTFKPGEGKNGAKGVTALYRAVGFFRAAGRAAAKFPRNSSLFSYIRGCFVTALFLLDLFTAKGLFDLQLALADFPLPQPEQHNETYEGLSQDYRRIGTMGLRELSWSSFFPVGRRYPFMPAGALSDGWAYVSFFERWRPRKVPFRMIVLDSGGACRLNMACTVDSFEPSVKRNGDIAYSITVTEYRFVQ